MSCLTILSFHFNFNHIRKVEWIMCWMLRMNWKNWREKCVKFKERSRWVQPYPEYTLSMTYITYHGGLRTRKLVKLLLWNTYHDQLLRKYIHTYNKIIYFWQFLYKVSVLSDMKWNRHNYFRLSLHCWEKLFKNENHTWAKTPMWNCT